MPAHLPLTSSVLDLCKVWLRSQKVNSMAQAQLLHVCEAFLIWNRDTKNWKATAWSGFLEANPQFSAFSTQEISLLAGFINQLSPFQIEVALYYFVLALKDSHCSPATVRNYRSDISQFFSFCQTKDITIALTKPKIAAFERYQVLKGLQASSIKRKTSSITYFWQWAHQQSLVGVAPTHNQPEQVPNYAVSHDSHPAETAEKPHTNSSDKLTSAAQPQSPSPVLPHKVTSTSPAASTTKSTQINQPGLFARLNTFNPFKKAPAHTAAATLKPPVLTPVAVAPADSTTPPSDQALTALAAQHPVQVSNRDLEAEITKLTQKVNAKTRTFLLPYITLALVILFFLGLGVFGYQQFYKNTGSLLAYPTTPVRASRVLSFQGRLTDTAQNPITAATNMTFKLFDSGPSTSGGTELWSSGTCSVTPDQDGIFNAGLGDDCGSEITNAVFTENANVWLQVTVGAETLSPRQPIRTVAYAINSETIQGVPISATSAATANTILKMDSAGDIVLGEVSPLIKSNSGTFTLEGQAVTIQTTSGSNGSINLAPDGTGGTNIFSNLNVSGYISAPGATLSATYAGGVPLTVKGGPSGTGNLASFQNNSGSTLAYIDASGHIVTAGNVGVASDADLLQLATNALTVNGSATVNGTGTYTSDLTLNGQSDLRLADSDSSNYVALQAPGTVSSNITYTLPGTLTNGYVLQTDGSGTMTWADPSVLAGATNYWTDSLGALYPKNSTFDFFLGGQSTVSAKFKVLNMTGSNSPVASISGSTTNVATYLTGEGNLQTTNQAPLTIGGITTGQVQIANRAGTAFSTFDTVNSRLGIGTATPATPFHIADSSEGSSTTGLQFSPGTSTADGTITKWGNSAGLDINTKWTGNSAVTAGITIGESNSWSPTLRFYTAYQGATRSERMRVTDLGLVGIGTTAPTALLHVNGGYSNNALATFNQLNSGDILAASASGTTRLRLANSGDLIFNQASTIQTSTGNLTLDSTGGTLELIDNTNVTGNLDVSGTFAAGTTNALTVDASGNLVTSGNVTATGKFNVGGISSVNYNAISDSGTATYAASDDDLYIEDILEVGGTVYQGGAPTVRPYYESRTLPTTVDNYVEIGSFSLTHGSHNLRANITVADTDFSVSKQYFIPIKFNQTASNWKEVLPLSDSGVYTGNDFSLQVMVSGTDVTLRIRRSAGTTAGTALVRLEQIGSTSDAFTASSGTGTTTAMAVFEGTAITQTAGKVGINTTAALVNALDINGDAALLAQGDVRLYDSDSTNYVALQAPASVTSNVTYTLPGTVTNGYVLQTDGSGTLTWADPSVLAGSTNYWTDSLGALYTKNNTYDFLIGAQSTGSAKFAVLNMTGAGTPTASVSSGLSGNGAYLTATGNLQTAKRNALTLGGTTTGQVQVMDRTGAAFSTFDTVNSRLGLGTTAPSYLLDVNGNSRVTGTSINTASGANPNYTYRNVFNYELNAANQTGAIVITMPNGGNSMVNIRISGYEFTLGKAAWETMIGGYWYDTGDDWIATSADIQGSPPFTRVRLMTEGGLPRIVLGDTTTVWQYPQIKVDVELVGYGSESGYATGWSAALDTTLAALTANDEPTIKYFVDGSGNYGIGTVTPKGKFVVSGAPGQGGNALAIFNQTAADDILTASVSGTTRLRLSNAGNLIFNQASTIQTSTGNLTLDSTGGTIELIDNTNITGNLDASGTFAAGTANALTIDASGNVVTTGTLTAATNETINGIDINAGAVSDITTLSASSTITFSSFTTDGGLLYTNGTGVMAQTTAGSAGQCLTSAGGGTPTWGACGGTSYWQLNAGALSPFSNTADVLIGGTASASAKFGFLNVNSGTPVASVSAGAAGALYITADGKIDTTAMQGISIGSNATSGKVGIGMAPTGHNLTVGGSMRWGGTGANQYIYSGVDASGGFTEQIGSTGTDDDMRFQTSVNGAGADYTQLVINPSVGVTIGTIGSGGGRLGVNTTSPDARIDSLSTSGEQLRLTYTDSTAYTAFTSNSVGDLTIAPSGSDLGITGNLDASGTFAAGTANALTIDASGNMVTTGTLTAATNETINGIDINAGAVSDVTTLSTSGQVTFSTFTTDGGLLYTNGSGVVAQTGAGSAGQCLQSIGGGAPTWGTCGASNWRVNQGALSPINDTLDLLVGSNASASAKFAVLNVNSGTPTASVSAGAAGAAYLTATGNLATTAKQDLSLGGTTTGNITVLNSSGTAFSAFDTTNGRLGVGVTNPAALFSVGTASALQIDASGHLTTSGKFNVGGISSVNYNAISDSGTASFASTDDDLYIEDILEVGGSIYVGGTQITANSLWANTSNVYHPAGAYASVVDMIIGGTATSSGSIRLASNGAAVFNEQGNDADFRIEGDTEANLFFVDASTDRIGIGTNTPQAKLDIAGATSTITNSSGDITIDAASGNISFAGDYLTNFTAGRGANGSVSAPTYSFTNDTDTGVYMASVGNLGLVTAGAEALRIDSAGLVGVGTTSPVGKFNVDGKVTGKALAIFNETGDQDIITASASGTTRFRIDTNGYVYAQRFVDQANSNYYLDPAATGTSLALVGNAGIGTSAPEFKLQTTGAITGKALGVFNETGDQSILVASSSGTRVFEVGHEGDLTVGAATKNDVDLNLYGDIFQQEGSNLTAITNITDTFIYDTTRDSDKGAWTNSLTARGSSWYTETKDDGAGDACSVSGDDRCGRSAFPKKATIVSTTDAVYIFDAQDNSLWMKFTQAGTYALGANSNNDPSSVFAMNGSLYIGTNGSSGTGLYEIDFKNDRLFNYDTTDRSQGDVSIGSRNSTVTYNTDNQTVFALLNSKINDVHGNVVAGKTLIAVASGANSSGDDTEGVSLIHKTDGKVVYMVRDSQNGDDLQNKRVWLTSKGTLYNISISELLGTIDDWMAVYYNVQLDSSETSGYQNRDASFISFITPALLDNDSYGDLALAVTEGTSTIDGISDTIYVGSTPGMTVIQNKVGDETNSSVKHYTKDYISEEMVGDIRGMWPLNSTVSTTSIANGTNNINDLSPKSSEVTAKNANGTGMTYVSGVRGTGISFDGTDDYFCSDTNDDDTCDVDSDLQLHVFSVGVWIKTTTTSLGTIMGYGATDGDTVARGWALRANGVTTGKVQFYKGNGSGSYVDQDTVSTATINDGQWHFVVGTFNTNTERMELYVDGKLEDSYSSSSDITYTNTNYFGIGNNTLNATNYYFNGQIDDPFVTAEILTPDQIRTMYLTGKQAAAKRQIDITDATAATSTTIADSGEAWTLNEFVGQMVELTGGTGSGQTRRVVSNTATTLTVSPAWSATPDTTTDFAIHPEQLYGTSNIVKAVAATDGGLGTDRTLYVGTSDGSDGGGITAIDLDGDFVKDIYQGLAGKTDENGTSWGTTTDYDDITALDAKSDVLAIGTLGQFWHERVEKTFTQVVDELRNQVNNLKLSGGGGVIASHYVDGSTYEQNGYQVIRKGWGYVGGNGGTLVDNSINFGITFDETPVILTNIVGATTATPTNITECVQDGAWMSSHPVSVSNSGFTVRQTAYDQAGGAAGNAYAIGYNYCYTWVAIGPYRQAYTGQASPWAAGADLAEWYATPDQTLQAGEIVSINNEGNISVVRSGQPYDAKAIGIVATKPAITLGPESGMTPGYDQRSSASTSASVAVALAGRVPVKVSLENGVIEAGDALTTSSLPGVAMRATRPGPIVGRAMERFDGTTTIAAIGTEAATIDANGLTAPQAAAFNELNAGIGTVMAFVNISYADPTTGTVAQSSLNSTYADEYGGKFALSSSGSLIGLGSYDFDSVDHWRDLANEDKWSLTNPLADLLNSSSITVATDSAIASGSAQLVPVSRQSVLDSALARLSNLGTLALKELNVARVRVLDTLFARQVETEHLVAERVQTDLITPLDNEDLTLRLASGSADTTSSLNIQNALGTNVATIDSQGNTSLLGDLLVGQDASISGDLTANTVTAATLSADNITGTSARLQNLEGKLAELEAVRAQTAEIVTATISGTLYADNIYNFDDKVAAALQKPSFLAALLGQDPAASVSASLVPAPNLVSQAGYTVATQSAVLNKTLADLNLSAEDVVLDADAVFINNYFKVNGNGYISNSLGIGDSLWIGSGMHLSDGVIEHTLSEEALAAGQKPSLAIQPSGQGTLSLMAGLMTLTDDGQVMVTGNLNVAGNLTVQQTLLTDFLSPTTFGHALQIQLATRSGQVAGVSTEAADLASTQITESRFELTNQDKAPVATISAQGRAEFSGGLTIANEDLTATTDNEVTALKTSGRATVQAYNSEVLIRSTLITPKSQIYVTPIGSTQNQVLYVKAQMPENNETPDTDGYFIVGFDIPAGQAVNFNWWIVN